MMKKKIIVKIYFLILLIDYSKNNRSRRNSHHSKIGTDRRKSLRKSLKNEGQSPKDFSSTMPRKAVFSPSASEINKQFLLSCQKGEKDSVFQFLRSSFLSKNYQDVKGNSALHYACEEGSIKIVDALIKNGVDINLLNFQNQSPLHISAKCGSFDISKLLVENGALLNIVDESLNLPAHYAAMANHVELLCYFLVRFIPSMFA